MKRISLIAASFVFAALFAVSAFGQAAAPAQQPAAGIRIAIVDTGAFAAKDSIARYSTAVTTLDTEFAPARKELEGLATRYQTLRKEFEDQQNAKGTPIAPETLRS